MGMTPQHFHTIPTSCAIHVPNYAHHKTLYMHLTYSYALNEQANQLCYSTVFIDPYLPCSAAIKFHNTTCVTLHGRIKDAPQSLSEINHSRALTHPCTVL